MTTSMHVIGLDIGTTNCKAILVDEKGSIVAAESVEYPFATPRSGWAEQDPALWWSAVTEAVRRIVAGTGVDSVGMIGISGQMHGLVALDRNDRVIRPAILWNDQRSADHCSAICSRAGGEDAVVSATGNLMLPGFLAGKLLWMKDNEPRNFDSVRTVLLPKDYVRFRLCGDKATDFSDASGTGMFDARRRCWAAGLLDTVGIPGQVLPAIRAASERAGSLSAEAAEAMGLAKGIPVMTGGGDAVMQTVGSATIDGSSVLVVIGTGGNVTVSVDRAPENAARELQLFCHVLPGRWALVGVSLTAGSSLRWFRDTFVSPQHGGAEPARNVYELLSEEASRSSPGSNGLLFVPYLQGERCPHVDSIVRGSWLGLSLGTTRQDAVRSVMEGVGFSLASILELVRRCGVTPSVIHLSGGGSASPVWRQIIADITATEVHTMDHSDNASPLGAAFLAGVQAGLWASIQEAVSHVGVKTVDRPHPASSRRYADIFPIFKRQYAALKGTYGDLHGVFGA